MAVTALFPRSLKFRLTGVVVLLVLAATVVVTWVALMLAEHDMKAIIGDQQYALLSGAAANIDEQLGARRQMLAALAESVPDAVRDQPGRMQDFIDRHPTARKAFYNLVVFDAKGELVHDARHHQTDAPLNVAGRQYFDDTLALKAGVISAPFRSQLSNMPVVLITQPIFDQRGEVALVLAGSIDLDNATFFEQISAQKPGKTGFIFIMTADGILVQHPTRARLLQHINARAGHNDATEMALRGFEGWTEANNKDGSPGIYSYKRLKSINWIVGARFPSDEAFAPMIAMRHQALLAATGFAAVAGALAWLAILTLLRPLGRLRRHIADIRAGRAAIGVLQRRRRDEIGELSTAFHELMAEREAAQERTRMIADSMPALIAYLDRDLRYRFTNAHFREMMQVEPDSMLGKTVAETFGEPFYQMLKEKLDAVLRGERVHYEREGVNQGRVVQLMGDMLPDFGSDGSVVGMYLMVMDITERKNAELTQAASEQRLKLLTDNLPVLISYLDGERRFRFVNATFRQWFGLDPARLIGQHLFDGIGAEHYRNAEQHLDQAYRGRRVTYELKARMADGIHTLETTFVPDQRADGSVAGVYSLTHDTTRMKEIEERLIQLARVDTLTGIANRLMFEEILQLALGRARRNRQPMALAYLDIDNFKTINDTLGHGAGDEVLKEFAARLVGNVRATDTVARLAGDEFVIIYEQVHNGDEALRLAAKIVEAVRCDFCVAGAPMRITTSIGIALRDNDDETPAALVARADAALYRAKRDGRDGYALDGMA
ncbi:diguanylate cyclase domain-containing protein [Rugamonas sp. DEMB1]|uniref:diguanylate cyclase domain-containing protein n=1 Tax=Rugamonas sp. DEMB1 TaxID=3039386 RepID=UPI00244922DD|nr:diguanylate cyclase [Rugamonas sp. DEMB1]WGG52942.1 diguanylate cyclase [Rugamonas sp. DEMB1]